MAHGIRFRLDAPVPGFLEEQEALRTVGSGTAGTIGGRCSAHLADLRTRTKGTRWVHGNGREHNSFQIKEKEWWRRGGANPRPKNATGPRPHAFFHFPSVAPPPPKEQEKPS